ncbi:hypothetical protein SLS61_003713 [Didymella pomorum]
MHLENVATNATNDDLNFHYEEVDEEPELHMRTWIAIAAVCVMNLVQTIAVQGPPAVITYIGRSLNNTNAEAWVPNACTLVQAVMAPILCSASDLFQVRKYLLIATGVVAFIGCGIAPGSQDINRLIAAQALIGVGAASLPLVYVVPSEILPRRWRPVAQAGINVTSIIAASAGPVALGGFTRSNAGRGWTYFYKLLKLDITGSFLLAAGLSLFLVGLNLGGGLFRTIRSPMAVAFLIWTGGLVGLATLQPSDGLRQIIFVGIAGLGFGGPVILILAGVQLAVPHKLIGTSSALTTSVRALAGTVFIAIYSTTLNNRLATNLPKQIAPAVLQLGLPATSLGAFIGALGAGNPAALEKIPGITQAIIDTGLKAFKQAFADSIRIVFIIAAPFGVAAIVLTYFLGSMRETMNYAVDAPMEQLHAKHHHTEVEHAV